MHNHYEDILERIDEQPQWFDDYGVPRYCAFSPQRLGNIYAREAALAEIACQNCGHIFRVALTDRFAQKGFSLSDEIRLHRVHYGDPPNIMCCDAGSSMNSIMREILEYWERDFEVSHGWQRNSKLEGRVTEPALDPPDTIEEISAAVRSGKRSLLTICSSRHNRFDLAARLTAIMALEGRVLVLQPEHYAVAYNMLKGYVPEGDFGYWKDNRKVTVCYYSRLEDGDISSFKTFIILSGVYPRRESEQKSLKSVSDRLAAETQNQVRIEFALPHSFHLTASPDCIIDVLGGKDAPPK